MKNLAKIKLFIGSKFLRWGAKLCLATDDQKQRFKNQINNNTFIGSFADSGGHIHQHINPMCEYDTQSVINVLMHEHVRESGHFKDGATNTKRIDWYKEEWC